MLDPKETVSSFPENTYPAEEVQSNTAFWKGMDTFLLGVYRDAIECYFLLEKFAHIRAELLKAFVQLCGSCSVTLGECRGILEIDDVEEIGILQNWAEKSISKLANDYFDDDKTARTIFDAISDFDVVRDYF